MFLVSFAKTFPCFSYVFHIATKLITSVPVNDVSFLDDVVFVLRCYQEFLNCVGTFKVNLVSCFATFVPETPRPLECGTTKKVLWILVLFLCMFVLLCCCY